MPNAQGNSRGLLNGSQAATDGYNWDAFGTLISRNGSNPTAYAWGEGSGYQSDADTGLKLLGHRYYDSRQGRFISQDPAGSGDNWYAYADNDPVDEVDPEGLQSVDEGNRQADALVDSADYNGQEIHWNDSNVPSFKDDNGVIHGVGFVSVPAPSGDGGGWFSGVGGAAMVGVSAVASQASFGFYNGGAARHDPSFGVSSGLAMAGMMAIPVGGEAKAEDYLTEELIKKARNIPIKQAEGLARDYGGKAKNWVKKSTEVIQHPNTGADVEIHWFQNTRDNIGKVLIKWKLDPYE